jgi:hypothetical protein
MKNKVSKVLLCFISVLLITNLGTYTLSKYRFNKNIKDKYASSATLPESNSFNKVRDLKNGESGFIEVDKVKADKDNYCWFQKEAVVGGFNDQYCIYIQYKYGGYHLVIPSDISFVKERWENTPWWWYADSVKVSKHTTSELIEKGEEWWRTHNYE